MHAALRPPLRVDHPHWVRDTYQVQVPRRDSNGNAVTNQYGVQLHDTQTRVVLSRRVPCTFDAAPVSQAQQDEVEVTELPPYVAPELMPPEEPVVSPDADLNRLLESSHEASTGTKSWDDHYAYVRSWRSGHCVHVCEQLDVM